MDVEKEESVDILRLFRPSHVTDSEDEQGR